MTGANAVSLIVQKQSGSNTVAVVDSVKARLARILPTLPADIRTVVIRDQSRFINNSMDEVKTHLALAALLVSVSILLFLRDWRTTIIATLSIPTSLIGTFACMYAMGFSINNFTMIGLILAVGIVVDDAVVVHENIFRHMEEYGRGASRGRRERHQRNRPGRGCDDAVAGGGLRPDRLHGRAGRPVPLVLRLRRGLLGVDEPIRLVHHDADAVRANS